MGRKTLFLKTVLKTGIPFFLKSLHRNKQVGVSSAQITERMVHAPDHDNPDTILKSTFYKQGKNHKSNVSPTYMQL